MIVACKGTREYTHNKQRFWKAEPILHSAFSKHFKGCEYLMWATIHRRNVEKCFENAF